MRILGSKSVAAALALGLIAVSGCTTVPYTKRSQFIVMSESEDLQLGAAAYQQVLKQEKIATDPRITEPVQRVGRAIAAAADKPDYQWEFTVIDDPKQVNAFCLPGGKVGIYTGILPITKDEAGLATVMGHEVAHAVARHGGERMSMAVGLQKVGEVSTAVLGSTKYGSWAPVFGQVYGVGSQVGVALPHSRRNESEADRMGLKYMAMAGYNPEAAVGFWQRFAEYNRSAGGDGSPWFLRTHPLDDARIQQIQAWLPEAKAVMKKP